MVKVRLIFAVHRAKSLSVIGRSFMGFTLPLRHVQVRARGQYSRSAVRANRKLTSALLTVEPEMRHSIGTSPGIGIFWASFLDACVPLPTEY